MMFEQELYNNFNISLPKSYFITFAGDVSFPFLHRCTFMSYLDLQWHDIPTASSTRHPACSHASLLINNRMQNAHYVAVAF